MKRNKLYFFILTACFLGYSWLFFLKFFAVKTPEIDFTVCISKRITNLPCPSCGTTRAVTHFFYGDFLTSLYLNPFGIIVAGIMVICPIWIAFDFFKNTQTFYDFYLKMESKIRTRKILFLLVILVLLNWFWNIYKQL